MDESAHRSRRFLSWIAALAFGLLVSCSSRASAQAPAPARAASARLEVVALPAPRHGHRIERVDGGLLSFGGFGDASVPDRETRQTFWLATGAKAWQRRADMNVGRAFFSSVTVDGVVHAIGEGVERYDAAADRWTSVLPADGLPRSHFAAAAVGRTIYVLGGYGAEGTEMSVIDLDGPKLRREAAPPGFDLGDHFHFVHALGGRLHVIGGLDGEKFEPQTEHWILTDVGWKAQPAPPPGLWAKFSVQAAVGDKLYLFGDFGAFCFDAKASSWTPRAKLEPMLVMPQAVGIEDVIWVIGGDQVEGSAGRLLLAYDIDKDSWRPAAAR